MKLANYFSKYLKEGEETVKIIRQYPWCYTFSIFLTMVLLALPFFLLFLLFRQGWWGVLIFCLLLLIGLFYGLRQLFIWYFDGFLITNQRIMDFDQKGFFDRQVSETTYEKIQDISFRQKGFWQTILNYGTVVVQTASSEVKLELENVFEPQKVQSLLTELTRKVTDQNQNRDLTAQELLKMLQSIRDQFGNRKVDQLFAKTKEPDTKQNGKGQKN